MLEDLFLSRNNNFDRNKYINHNKKNPGWEIKT